jgi:hypothetical protein
LSELSESLVPVSLGRGVVPVVPALVVPGGGVVLGVFGVFDIPGALGLVVDGEVGVLPGEYGVVPGAALAGYGRFAGSDPGLEPLP